MHKANGSFDQEASKHVHHANGRDGSEAALLPWRGVANDALGTFDMGLGFLPDVAAT